MKLYLGTYFDTPLYFHWSALILYAAILPSWAILGGEFWAGVITTSFLFASIACHEYGHVSRAKKEGVKADSVYLAAIGGIASMTNVPRGTWSEFRITVAGPLVNLAIGTAILFGIVVSGPPFPENYSNPLTFFPWETQFWVFLGAWNFLVCGFNLIPMYPSDGGRILRSLLSRVIGLQQATNIATGLGILVGGALMIFSIANFAVVGALVGGLLVFASWGERQEVLN